MASCPTAEARAYGSAGGIRWRLQSLQTRRTAGGGARRYRSHGHRDRDFGQVLATAKVPKVQVWAHTPKRLIGV
jgi:hypothetical protein